jgi:hypothetical protein
LQGRVGRYAHKEGVKCGCSNRSVLAVEDEAEFGRLIKLLTVRADALPLMTELAIQADKVRNPENRDIDPETEKQDAIALCKRRIEAAINLYGDGRITRDEYLRRVELNEREITYWEARTTEAEKASLELAMCMDAVDKLSRLWDVGEPEDRQGMARSLFTYVAFDLDTRQITNFRLKPWADRFLVLRAALYENENGSGTPISAAMTGLEPVSRDVLSEGFWNISSATPSQAVAVILRLLYKDHPLPAKPVSDIPPLKADRNCEIARRYLVGERAVDLAKEFGISVRRVNKLIRRYLDRNRVQE